MYLKSIKLSGFKSFVDPTLIPMKAQLNSIVGPNGCGKSNVVDAIRWVIGEMSAKQLRGQSMTDVIFNGTTQRHPVGKASVELLFENNEGRLGGPYASYSEIAIRREIERDGQSDYFINGTTCRRRDILDIFLGTGLGSRSYSIIEQGTISRLVEAKPEELRVYLEEVAGISKYKERRKETENRMHRTQENLSRLRDILEELTKQQRHLKRQANAAERYTVLKQEERLLNAQLKALHWRLLNEDLSRKDVSIREQMTAYERELADQRSFETNIEKARNGQDEANSVLNEVQREYYSLGAEIARFEQRIQNIEEQSGQWQLELEQSVHLSKELKTETVSHREKIARIKYALENAEPDVAQAKLEAEEAQAKLEAAEKAMQQWQERWDQFQSLIQKVSQETEVSKTKVGHYQERIQHLQGRLSKLAVSDVSQAVEDLQSQLQPIREKAENLQQELHEVELTLSNVTHEINEQRQKNSIAQEKLDCVQEDLQNLKNRYATLEGLQQAALGGDNEALNKWLNESNLSKKPRLAHRIKVSPEWEGAVEVVLHDYFDALCVETVHEFARKLLNAPQGRLTLIEKSKTLSGGSLPHDTLALKVESDGLVEAWLSQVYIAKDLAEAHHIRKKLTHGQSVITVEGVWLGPNWVRTSKPVDKEASILSRQKLLETLTQKIEMQAKEVEEQQQLLRKGEEKTILLEGKRDRLQEKYQALNIEYIEIKTQSSSQEARLIELKHQQERLMHEKIECEEEIEALKELLIQTESKWQSSSESQTEHTSHRDDLLAGRDTLRETLLKRREESTQKTRAADELIIRLDASKNELNILTQSLERNEQQLKQLALKKINLEKYLSESGSPLQVLRTDLQTKLDERLKIEERLHAAEASVESNMQVLKALESKRQNVQACLNEQQRALEDLRMERQTILVKQEGIREQIVEADFDLDKLLEELPSEVDVETLEESLANVSKRIERIGPINLAAIDEHKSVTERKEYLDRQERDLAEALEILQGAIRKIDRETRVRFRETFDKVNEGLKIIFPKIFGGGHAELELTEQDLLTTGVLVKAQPPGKRNTSIYLLSGGEKALAAIALVFALFQLNPAPFCILDEVDAPLDDQNVGRFCQLVKEMSKKTQFIVITHNKVTMEMGDVLMGVTMQEPGVSRIVAVEIEEAVKLAEPSSAEQKMVIGGEQEVVIEEGKEASAFA